MCSKVFLCALMSSVTYLMSVTNGQTMDEIILSSSTSLGDFDFFQDLNGKEVRQELDMKLLKEQYEALYATDGSRTKRKAVRHLNYRWPQNTIPYKIARGVFTQSEEATIKAAINEWQQLTCIKIRPATSRDNNYIYFNNGRGCYSYVGKVTGSQEIGLAKGCRVKGVIVHEIGHAVGFHHEQNRPDRDEHVRIISANIPQSVRYNFKKYSKSAINTYDVPYDYTSVMHYGGKYFSNNGGYTIRTVDSKYQSAIGNREGLSYHDVMLANRMYQCDKHCPTSIVCPRGSFKGKDCKCYCKSSKKGEVLQECNGNNKVTTDKPGKTTTIQTTTPEVGCKDIHEEKCLNWAKSHRNFCETNMFVQSYCKKSCGTCDSVDKADCSDKQSGKNCKYWKEEGYCTDKYATYMASNCQKTCNLCERSTEFDKITGSDQDNLESKASDKSSIFYIISLVMIFIQTIAL